MGQEQEPCEGYWELTDEEILWALDSLVFHSQLYEHAQVCKRCKSRMDDVTKKHYDKSLIDEWAWNEANV